MPQTIRNIVFAFSLCLLSAQAQFDYTTNNGTITITRYTGPGGDVTIPSTINGLPVTSIGGGHFMGGAFGWCFNLTSIVIPNSVTSIGTAAFWRCGSLPSVTLPSNLTSIEDWAFSDCSSLTNLIIPGSVTNIGLRAFYYCTSLTAITVDTSNSFYSSVDGVLFDNSQTTLIQYPGAKPGNHYAIPNGVTSIGSYACAGGNHSLSSVDIPNSATSIGDWAFAYCSSLTNFTVGEGVTSIGHGAFASTWLPTFVCFTGNAPTNVAWDAFITYGYVGSDGPFTNTCNLFVYYFPGTTGWGLTLGGRPTVCWDARVTEPVRTIYGFRFTVTGNSNLVVAVEASTDLSTWSRLHTIPLTGEVYSGAFYYLDGDWTNYPARFYRLRWP